MTEERWALCTVSSDYEVSDMGSLRRATAGRGTSPGRPLRPSTDKKGYQHVSIGCSDKPRKFKVHRLVALAWIPNPGVLETVNHIDGDKRNNRVSNLEWCSVSENIEHAFRAGLKKFGEDHERAILSAKDVLDARAYLIAGESLSTVGERFGVSLWTIHNIVRGLTWKRIPSDPEWDRFLIQRRAIHEQKRRGIAA